MNDHHYERSFGFLTVTFGLLIISLNKPYQEWNTDHSKFFSSSPSPYFISITTRYQHDYPETIGSFRHLRQFRTFAKTRSTPGLPKFYLLLIFFLKVFLYVLC